MAAMEVDQLSNGKDTPMSNVSSPPKDKKRKKKAKKTPKYDPSKNPIQVLNESYPSLEYEFNKVGKLILFYIFCP